MNLKQALPQLLPLAISWAETEAATAAQTGIPLTTNEEQLARSVGVQRPELVRIALVPQLPQPQHSELRMAARQAKLLGPGMTGLTLGYTVFIVSGHKSPQLLSHEFRHVYQYEQLGSIAAFLPIYLAQIIDVGYSNAPLEADARSHEVCDF